MDLSDSGEFSQRLVALAEVFDVKLSPQRQALYFEALRDVPFDAVVVAMNAAVKTSTFFPRPAEIRTLAFGNTDDQTEAAWMVLKEAMHRIGSYASLVVMDAALGDTIVAMFGSWSLACASDFSPEMWAAKRKEFSRVYRVFKDRGGSGSRYLVGQIEKQNAHQPAWARFTPVGVIDGAEVRSLGSAEAEACRTAMAVSAGAASRQFSRFEAAMPPSLEDAS